MRLRVYKFVLLAFFTFLIFYILLGSRLVHFKDYSDLRIGLISKDKIRTGDVFLLSYESPFRVVGQSFLGSRFFHPALMFWEGKELFVLEYAQYNPPYDGINKIPFEIWYRINRDSLFLHNSLTYTGELNLSEEINKYYLKYQNMKVIDRMAWTRMMINQNKRYVPKNITSDAMICTEFLAQFFIEIGAVKNVKALEKYEPEDYVGMKGFTLHKDFNYDYYLSDMSLISY